MSKLITAGALALFLVGCTAESGNGDNNTPNASAVATDATATFELGKNI